MTNRFKLVIAGAALVALPGVAQAQASQEILLSSTVNGACGMGTPSSTVINLQDLTGPNGLLDPAKTGTTVLGSTTIADAWCNAPHSVSMESAAMSLQSTPPYAQPAYMARRVTYRARLVGWPVGMSMRPRGDNDLSETEFFQAHAAPASGLQLQVSELQTLAIGNTEQAGLMLEPGNYRGTVTIKLAVQ